MRPDRPSQWFRHPAHGPLPVLLLGLTVATGVVDAVSILALGRVFVANMTGNVAFIGFALAGASGFSLSASVLALAGFLLGAAVTGSVIGRWRPLRGRLLAVATTAELVLLAVGLVIATISTEPFAATPQNLIAVIAATALGIQNASARELAVPDSTTTVLTMTLTGFAADLRNRNGRVLLRRLARRRGHAPRRTGRGRAGPASGRSGRAWPWPSSWSRSCAPEHGCSDNAPARGRPGPAPREIADEQARERSGAASAPLRSGPELGVVVDG